MSDQWWSYVLTIIGIAGFYLAGKKVWWAWYINIANQILWFAYAIVTDQLGFIFGALFYTAVFAKNAYAWTREHHENAYEHTHNPNVVGRVLSVQDELGGITVHAMIDDPKTRDLISGPNGLCGFSFNEDEELELSTDEKLRRQARKLFTFKDRTGIDRCRHGVPYSTECSECHW